MEGVGKGIPSALSSTVFPTDQEALSEKSESVLAHGRAARYEQDEGGRQYIWEEIPGSDPESIK